ncbi:uncharacterized protein LOC122396964 [Colletes gigas]|uniref:uncharacterized protein LOC122396964 n=1 Tax=Colletes gigas TaxID=935657 RepID=UPI001C9B1969|nr:uncharacterized protein LOC122396964 [Colletes gigas]
MFKNVTPERAIYLTQLSIALNCSWPLPPTATKSQVICFKVYRFLTNTCAFIFVLPLFYSMYINRDDSIILTRVACFIDALCHVYGQAVLSILHYDRIQAVVYQMTEYCANATSLERSILQQYLDKYAKYYAMAAMWVYGTGTFIVVGNLFVPQPFPVEAEYPFPVDYEPLRTVIFLHHGYVVMQCAAVVCINMFAALLLFFAAARFEILMVEFRAVHNIETLTQCVQKYYRVRSYAMEVVSVIQYTAIYTTMMATLPLVLCGLNVIGRQPPMVKMQFVFLAGTVMLEVFMCAWPADNLMEVSENAIRSFYESTWYDGSVRFQKNLLLSLMPQEPVAISLACLIPVLSLRYYCSYVSNAFSIFTALRLVVNEDE